MFILINMNEIIRRCKEKFVKIDVGMITGVCKFPPVNVKKRRRFFELIFYCKIVGLNFFHR